MTTYASPVWHTKKTIILRELRGVTQRLPLIMITKAFKTTSNASLNILSKLAPVHGTVETICNNEWYGKLFMGQQNFFWKADNAKV